MVYRIPPKSIEIRENQNIYIFSVHEFTLSFVSLKSCLVMLFYTKHSEVVFECLPPAFLKLVLSPN